MTNTKSLPQGFHKSALSCETLFLQPADSDFYQCLCESLKFAERYPEVLEMIERDQDQHGLKKKVVRKMDRVSEIEKLSHLEFIEDNSVANIIEISSLERGRPRMSPLTVFLYLMAESFLGGSTTTIKSKNYLADSQTIFVFLMHQQIKVPGASTIHENLRCLTPTTVERIFDLQVKMIVDDELDSFKRIFIDSTGVMANSAWPTDSFIMHGLARRTMLALTRLHKMFGNAFSDKKLTEWIQLVGKIDFEISMVKGKVNAEVARKKLYRKLLAVVKKFIVRATKRMTEFRTEYKDAELNFSGRKSVAAKIEIFAKTVGDLLHASDYCRKRIFDDVNTASTEKILSLCDEDVAFIIKGGRDTVLGYKPQVALSDNMFITSVLVPEGNAADSDMLLLSVDDSNARTGVMPRVVSTDDGYVSGKNLKELTDLGVEVVSFGGSKGKKLLKARWEQEDFAKARNDRSKAESIMFSIKHLFDFGQLQRRGVDEARVELTMKAVIYNFYHIAKKKRESKKLIAVA